MANVTPGLFADPTVVEWAQRQGPMTTDQMHNTLRGSFFNLGGGLHRGLAQAFGADPRTPQEKRAAQVQAIMKQADFQDPNSIMGTINKLNQDGFQAEALKLFEVLPTPMKPDKRIVDEWFQVTNQGGTTRKSLFQRDNLGFIHEVGAVSDSMELNGWDGFSDEWTRDIQFDEDSRNVFLNRISNLPEFQGWGFSDDTEGDELKAFTGLIAKVANDLKDNHRRAILEAMDGGLVTAQQANRMAEIALNDDWYLDTAFERFIEADGVKKNIDRGWDLAGADARINPNINTTDYDAMNAAIAKQDAKAKAISDFAAEKLTLVRGGPDNFNIARLKVDEAKQVFTRMGNKTNEQIAQELRGMGYNMSDAMMASHGQRWDWMREDPETTAKFINLLDSPRMFRSERYHMINRLEKDGKIPQMLKAVEILNYLKKMDNPGSSNPRNPRKR